MRCTVFTYEVLYRTVELVTYRRVGVLDRFLAARDFGLEPRVGIVGPYRVGIVASARAGGPGARAGVARGHLKLAVIARLVGVPDGAVRAGAVGAVLGSGGVGERGRVRVKS